MTRPPSQRPPDLDDELRDSARARITRGKPGTFGEHDLFYGLTGLGVVLLRAAPASDALGDILAYLTTIVARPLALDGVQVPGWWSARDPTRCTPPRAGTPTWARPTARILAFLPIGAISGHAVEGQHEAIGALCDWYDRWGQDAPEGRSWPEWPTLSDLRAGRPSQHGRAGPPGATGRPEKHRPRAPALRHRYR